MSAVDIDSAMDYAEHAPLRRGGGGGGAPIVVPLGFMLIVLAVFAVPMYKLRQPNLMVALIIGVIAGGTGLAPSLKPFELDYSIKALEIPLVDALVEMGIMLLLFFAGLSIDAGPELLKKYYRLILVMGLGQIAFSWGIYSLIAWASGLCATGPSITYFGLVCTLSSGLLMHNAMDDGMNGTLHGKIMRGILLIQDVTITIALVILPAFVARPGLKLGAGRRAETVEPGATAAPSYASDDYAPVDSGAEVGRLIGIFIGFLVVLSIVTYFILGRMMRFFSLSNEMLFIGVFSYVVGIAGICTYLGFSWAVGAFLAGVSLTFTSMRLEIESKLFSMRTFGMVVNAFLLGVQVPATQDIASKVWGWALLMAFTRVFLQWIILGFFGKLAGVKARTAFFVSNCMNQFGEISLIVSTLAWLYGVFSSAAFVTILLATIFSLCLSAIGIVFGNELFELLRPVLQFLDNRTDSELRREKDFKLENHVVLLGFNETGLEIAEFYRKRGQDVLMVDLDPELHRTMKEAYKGSNATGGVKSAFTFPGNTSAVPAGPFSNAFAQSLAAPIYISGARFGDAGADAPAEGEAVAMEQVAGGNFGEQPMFVVPPSSPGAPVAQNMYVSTSMPGAPQVFYMSGAAPTVFQSGAMPMAMPAAPAAPAAEEDPFVGSSIFSVYADPEESVTWSRYNLDGARLVVSCMVDGQAAEVALSSRLKAKGVPFLAVSNSNNEATELYEAGCAYVIQQEYLASQVVGKLFKEEGGKGTAETFRAKGEQHMRELDIARHDKTREAIGRFI